jgi:hypothetical protein
MTGGIGDFSVLSGKDLSGLKAGTGEGQQRTQSSASSGKPRRPGSGNSHYIVLLKKSWEQEEPIRFHNGFLDDIRTRLKLTAKVPLPEMPNFFPSGAEGEINFSGRDVLHVDSALREQNLFSHLEALKELVQKCADRKTTFPEFISGVNKIPIPASWRNEIVNGLFENATSSSPALPLAPKPPGLSQDIDKLMELLNEKDTGGSRLSPHLGRFLEEVGRDSTGFTLRDGAARQLHKDLTQTLIALRGSLLRQVSLAETLGFISSLQRLARCTKGRDRQTVHLWSQIPTDPRALLVGEKGDSDDDFSVAIVLQDPWERDASYLKDVSKLAADLNCPLLMQVPSETLPEGETLSLLRETCRLSQTYFFAGGVASRVDEEACVFRPAVLAFLEGLVSSKENVDFYLHRALILEDQDLITEKGQARSTDKLLDQTQIVAISSGRINRVNGGRNQSIASFPLLNAWEEA